MDEKTKRKMCWNCEGNIPLDQEVCPYCRASTISHVENKPTPEEATHESDQGTFEVLTMALLMGGCFFFLFSLLLYFFSDKGFLTLRWSDSYAIVYLVVSLGMLYFGFRNLRAIEK